MASFVHAINAFNGGEISPHLAGRTDIQKYNRSAATILNFIVQSEGGLVRRSGTRFIKAIKDSSVTSELIPFIYSTEEAYIIEFGASYFRFYRDEGAVLETAQTITAITAANPAVVTIGTHGYSNGDEVYITGVGGMTELNGRFFTVANAATNTFELSGEDSTAYTAFTTGGTAARVYQITHTYTQSELVNVKYAQSADILYLAHPLHAPAKLSRTGHTAWTLTDISFEDGPYLAENATKTQMTPSGATGSITIAASSTNGINDGAGFQDPQDVGRIIRVNKSATSGGGWGTITAVNSTTNVDVDVEAGAMPTAARSTWRIGAWYTANYPAAVSFGEGRLWWGGEPNDPQTIHGSKSANFESHEPQDTEDNSISDDNAITYTIGSNRVNEIKWMEVGRNLIIGTPGSVMPVQASSNNEPVTPTNINVPVGSPVGAYSGARPARVNNFVVYIDTSQRRLRGLRYSLDTDAFISEDLNRIAKHITTSGMTQIDYQLLPDSVVWCVRSDGKVAALTFVPEEEVFAWSLHQIGGSFSTGDAVVEKVAVIPAPNGQSDQVYFIVKRTVNGATARYIEFIEDAFGDADDIEDAFFVDSGLSYSGSAVTTVQGLNHLEGETVQVLADGAFVGTKTVASGSVTLDTAASDIHIGLSYNSDLGTLRLDAPGQPGRALTTQGIYKRIANAIVRFHRTNTGKFGRDSANLDPIQFRDASDAMDTPVPLFTGDKKLGIEMGWDREAQLYFRQDAPLPFHLIAMTLIGDVGER